MITYRPDRRKVGLQTTPEKKIEVREARILIVKARIAELKAKETLTRKEKDLIHKGNTDLRRIDKELTALRRLIANKDM